MIYYMLLLHHHGGNRWCELYLLIAITGVPLGSPWPLQFPSLNPHLLPPPLPACMQIATAPTPLTPSTPHTHTPTTPTLFHLLVCGIHRIVQCSCGP